MRVLIWAALVAACGDRQPEPVKTTPSENTALIATLRDAIDNKYSYRDRLGLDWNKLFAEAGLEQAATRDELIARLGKLLANARDAHLDLIVDGKYIATDPAKPALNIAIAEVQKRVADFKVIDKCLYFARAGAYAFVLINSLENGRCDALTRAWSAIYPQIASMPGLILDLRGNAGGNEEFAMQIAGHFVDKPTPYVKARTRDVNAPDGFGPAYTRQIAPVPGVEQYKKPVVVLTGPYNMSSAEAFILMMRAAGATLMGSRTRGASAKPVIVELGQGISVRIPTWKAMLLDGTLYEGVGIAPDVEVPVTPAELASGDKIIDAAIAALDKKLAK
jgi:hypothetical protein